MPSVTLIILNWNGADLLPKMLPPLFSQTLDNFHTIIVDNASDDNSVAYIKENYPQIELIENRENLGFSKGINVGLKAVLYEPPDYTILLNNDVIVSETWLEKLVTALENETNIGVAGCKLLFPNRTIQHLGGYVEYPLTYGHHLHVREPDTEQITDVTDVEYVTGAAMVITKPALQTVGLLDERFSPFYFEETDYCYMVRNAGFRVVVIPSATAIHDESTSVEKVSGLKALSFHRNRMRFVLKHFSSAKFVSDFLPAEKKRFGRAYHYDEYRLMRRVYLETLLQLPELMENDGRTDEIEPFRSGLLELRAEVVRQAPAGVSEESKSPVLRELNSRFVLQEFEFGEGIIGRIRTLWNSVAAKWTVRHLIQQQTEFNRLVTGLLEQRSQADEVVVEEINTLLTEIDRLRREIDTLKNSKTE